MENRVPGPASGTAFWSPLTVRRRESPNDNLAKPDRPNIPRRWVRGPAKFLSEREIQQVVLELDDTLSRLENPREQHDVFYEKDGTTIRQFGRLQNIPSGLPP